MAFSRKSMLMNMLREAAMPVGSFMWWFGLESKIPSGWLKLDGSSFDSTEYPELYDILGSTTLPNMIDKFIKGGNTGGVSQSAGLPNPSISASLSNLTFTGTAKNISLSGTPSGTISGEGKHIHSGLVNIQGWGTPDTESPRGYRVTGSKTVTNADGAHTHTFTGNTMTLSGSYTPSGSVSGSVSVNVGSTSIYGKSSTVTPANVSAIPIIKAGERVGFYSDEQIDNLFNQARTQIENLENRIPVLNSSLNNHKQNVNAHSEIISQKVSIQSVNALEIDINDLESLIEDKEQEAQNQGD